MAVLAGEKDRPGYQLQEIEAWLRAADHARAFAAVNALAEAKGTRPDVLYRLAGLCAQLGALVPADAFLNDRYAARAVALLTQASLAGHFREPARLEQLRKDTRFAPLRARADYQALLARLTAGQKSPDGNSRGPEKP